MYEVNMNVRDFKRLSRRISETYFGILTLHQEDEKWLFPLYQEKRTARQSLVQCHAPRGHGGACYQFPFTPLRGDARL